MSASRDAQGTLARAARVTLSVAVCATLLFGDARVARSAAVDSGPDIAVGSVAPLPPAGPTQVVVYDRIGRTTTLVSHGRGASEGAGSSSRPSISADGGLVAFESAAALVATDTNDKRDVYLWVRAGDAVRPISVARDGSSANGDSRDPSISGDGGVIAFASTATNLTRDSRIDGTASQVFAWQRAAAATTLVSVGDDGPGSVASSSAAVSRDGRVVAFESAADDLVDGDTNGVRDIFLRDLTRQATIRASVDAGGGQVGADSRRPSVTGNGGAVAFDSRATNIVPRDTNQVRDVFARDLPPALQVTPDPLDFGVVPLGTPGSQSVAIVSVGWTPVAIAGSTISGTDAADFVVAGDLCSGQVLAYGTTCTVAVLHVPQTTGPRSATLSITDSAPGSPHLVALVGGVPAPQIRLEPAVGPPGVVTTLRGSDFPPGALVTITWDRGITQALDPVSVSADGTFTVGVLVYHRDRLGPRTISVTAAPGGPTFPENTAPFLVVPAQVQPTGADALLFVSPELQLVVRR